MRSQQAAKEILRNVSAGQFRPGMKLNEVDLAEELGVSRNTLRESFSQLEQQGVINRIPNRGVFIVEPTVAMFQDIYHARMVMEPGAILAAEDIDIDELALLVEQSREYRKQRDYDALAFANQRFHFQIVASAGSEILLEGMEKILAQMRLGFLEIVENQPDFHMPYVEENAELVRVLRRGNREAAAALLRSQLNTTCRHVCAVLEAQ